MRLPGRLLSLPLVLGLVAGAGLAGKNPGASAPRGPAQAGKGEGRMDWWSDARFGLFIHWGLYSVPAGEWGASKGYGEWILSSAKIPLPEYEAFQKRFNPAHFDADAWVRAAKDAGFKYLVITTKHHDGFGLFDSALTDWTVMGTPFRRDIMKEVADACHRQGMRLGFYHSIMDWHHPDYLPRRPWDTRPAADADFSRYQAFLKGQMKELLTKYGPVDVLWFDGQWEGSWTHKMGQDLYAYVRSLQPGVLVNNRVDKGGGEFQMTLNDSFAGDFGTPEQEVPPMGIPGVPWETCMTMNDHWGFNRADSNWKSSAVLIRKLADIASKGGNYLLNVGPDAEGAIPAPSLERMKAIGAWMKVNGEAIYGTQASPFPSLPWGRCTRKDAGKGAKLFFHVFDWPANGELRIPGLLSPVRKAWLMAAPGRALKVNRDTDGVTVAVPAQAPDSSDTVVVLELPGQPEVALAPVITAATPIFIDTLDLRFTPGSRGATLHYTLDGSEPTPASPQVQGSLRIRATCTVKCRAFRGATPAGSAAVARFTRVAPRPAVAAAGLKPGLDLAVFEGNFQRCDEMVLPVRTGSSPDFSLGAAPRAERYGLRFEGYLEVPHDGTYTFFTASDDGSRLYLDGDLIVDNDKPHGPAEKAGYASLAKGLHRIRVDYFQGTDGADLQVQFQGPAMPRRPLEAADLTH